MNRPLFPPQDEWSEWLAGRWPDWWGAERMEGT
jgi:hypothetical protein